MAALRYILLAAAITLTLALLAHLCLPARAPIGRCTGRRGGLGIAVLTAVYAVAAFCNLGSAHDPQRFCSFEAGESAVSRSSARLPSPPCGTTPACLQASMPSPIRPTA
ncbi:MAG: hypothetical protein ACLTG4_04760 [Oscillospiraceae bacterium]